MLKLFLATILSCVTFFLSACGGGSNDGGIVRVEDNVTDANLSFRVYSGIQTDIMHQRMEVINSDTVLDDVMAEIASMSGDTPVFNEDNETLVLIVSDEESCVYSPEVEEVYDTNLTVQVTVVNRVLDAASRAVCNPIVGEFYAYRFVKIAKEEGPISVIVKDEE